jgi:hypothetical protein
MIPALYIPAIIALVAQGTIPETRTAVLDHLDNCPEVSGCGIYFSLASAKKSDPPAVFWWGFGPEGALVKISGKLHRLEQVGESEDSKGKRITEVWADSKIKIRLEYRVVKPVYEGAVLRGTLTVIAGSKVMKYQVKGYKGC